ncbi:MAG TPA: hypothetical protein VM756_01645 [Burkholderiales bacterium]|jgi:hypothetical protein|nr:hypothetical protein [Burkholderiales bacterium]
MSEPGPALTRYTFTGGLERGTSLTLFPTSLVHRGDNHLETLPLGGMTAVRVAFERNARKLGWGIGLILGALLMLAVTGPLTSFASNAANDMAGAGAQGVPRALYSFFRLLEAFGSMLPVAALACVIGGGALCALGWIGSTTLLICLPGTERVYPVRGRDTLLLDFAEALSERLMLLRK